MTTSDIGRYELLQVMQNTEDTETQNEGTSTYI